MKALTLTLSLILLACGGPVEVEEQPEPKITNGVYDILIYVTNDTCWWKTGLRITEWEIYSDGSSYELTFGSDTTLQSTENGNSIQFTQELHESYIEEGKDCISTMTVLINILPDNDNPDVFTGEGELVITSTCNEEEPEFICRLDNTLHGRLQDE